ncbi:MAG: inositol monophosphatase family protein [Pseudomonadota bacterium]
MHQPIVNIALNAARAAGRVIEQALVRADQLTIEAKGQNDFVTAVDRAAEAAVIDVIQKTFPKHDILGEEGGRIAGKGGGSDTEWIIDPLDGTTNFIHGFPQFAVSIGIQVNGRMEHAVVFDPLRKEEFTASRGRGAQLNGRRIRVSDRKTLEGALIGTGFPFRKEQMPHIDAYLAMFKDLASQTAGIRRPGSAALDLAYVAAGRMDGFWEFGLKPWDMAAGCLLITEAGGLVSDFNGGETHMEKGHIVGGNPKVLKALLKSIAPHVPENWKR